MDRKDSNRKIRDLAPEEVTSMIDWGFEKYRTKFDKFSDKIENKLKYIDSFDQGQPYMNLLPEPVLPVPHSSTADEDSTELGPLLTLLQHNKKKAE